MKLFLCGGGSEEKTIEANRIFNETIDNSKPLLYVPLAMDPDKHPYEGCLEWIKGEMNNVDIPYIEMVESFEDLASKNYYNYSAIFIGGGNTFKLLKGLKDSGAFLKIRDYIEHDGIVFGGSAGAIIFGYDINSCLPMDKNEVNLKDTKGFNVLNGLSLFAHYTNQKDQAKTEELTRALQEYTINHEQVIALPEEDTIFINGDEIQVIGNKDYYRFRIGARSTIQVPEEKCALKK